MGTHIFAAEKAGPFDWSSRVYDPANPQDTAIARDGTLELAQKFEGTNQSGVVKTESWNGDSMAGSRIWGAGVNLFGPANQNFFIGLKKDWSLREGSDAGNQWIYYPKYQQDAVVMFGFAEAKAKDLDRANGTGFTLEKALPYNRLVVVLPWRWVQGGGSAYQAGDYGGNPYEAGLFAIPANMSLSQVQANTATYRLAGLDAVLTKIQPHLYSTCYKLQVLGNGRWQVLIDIDSDGQTDVATTSEDAGNKVSPFANLTEKSGLIISTRAAPSRTLTVNRTTANLIYRRSPTAEVPTIDRRPFTANIPKAVKSSPTIIDGTSWDATYQVSATCSTIPTGVAPVAQIPGTNQWFFDLPLKPNGLSKVTFGQSGKPTASTIQRSIEWQPIDMYHGESLAIRIGDSVKLQCLASCGAQKIRIDADGDGVIDYRGPDTKQFLHRYNTAGTFLAKAYDADGVQVGSATIAVANVRLPKAIACQVGFTRTVDIHTGLYDPKDLYVTSNDPTLMTVTRGTATTNHLRIMLKPLKRGTPVLQVRQGSITGQILASKEVDEFTLNTNEIQSVVINNENRMATGVIIMAPFIPNIDINMDFFASSSSFFGNKTLFISTNDITPSVDPITGDIVGRIKVGIQVPLEEDKMCFSVGFLQENQQRVPVGNIGSINGTGCDLGVDIVRFIYNSVPNVKPITITCYNKGRNHRGHSVSVDSQGWQPAPTLNYIAACPDPVGRKNPPHVFFPKPDVTISVGANPTPIRAYGVLIDNTLFEERIEVRKGYVYLSGSIQWTAGLCVPSRAGFVNGWIYDQGSVVGGGDYSLSAYTLPGDLGPPPGTKVTFQWVYSGTAPGSAYEISELPKSIDVNGSTVTGRFEHPFYYYFARDLNPTPQANFSSHQVFLFINTDEYGVISQVQYTPLSLSIPISP